MTGCSLLMRLAPFTHHRSAHSGDVALSNAPRASRSRMHAICFILRPKRISGGGDTGRTIRCGAERQGGVRAELRGLLFSHSEFGEGIIRDSLSPIFLVPRTSSLALDADGLDHSCPFCGFATQAFGELFWCAAAADATLSG